MFSRGADPDPHTDSNTTLILVMACCPVNVHT